MLIFSSFSIISMMIESPTFKMKYSWHQHNVMFIRIFFISSSLASGAQFPVIHTAGSFFSHIISLDKRFYTNLVRIILGYSFIKLGKERDIKFLEIASHLSLVKFMKSIVGQIKEKYFLKKHILCLFFWNRYSKKNFPQD